MTIAFQPPRDGALVVVDLDRQAHGDQSGPRPRGRIRDAH
jgi:hypothetical protein